MFFKIIKLSLKTIFSNKMRSFLTMLGIVIGVMAVVVLVSITEGATTGITDSISSMGADLITASVNSDDVSLTYETLENLSKFNAVESIAPVITTSQTVKKKSTSSKYSIVGVTPSYFDVQSIDIQRGRLIYESDIEYNTKVCILGTEAATDLFGTWDAVDGTIMIGSDTYKVIGVLQELGSSLTGSDDSKILIPFTTAQKLTNTTSINTFYVKATSTNEKTVSQAISNIEMFLYQLTRDEDTYEVNNQSSVLDTMDDVTNTMSVLLAGIAAISLLVGGIGIMNIMLVSVSERTKEIGIRKAVGAKTHHILFQFLCESCVLSTLGGLVGLLLSVGVVEVYNLVTSTTCAINYQVALLSIIFCVVIGLIFGGYPASKASKLQPIEALHSI